jgi:mRNA interferase MazF
VVRGDAHRITLPTKRGHVQKGRRYAVIVQADDLLALSTVVICPTSRSAFDQDQDCAAAGATIRTGS